MYAKNRSKSPLSECIRAVRRRVIWVVIGVIVHSLPKHGVVICTPGMDMATGLEVFDVQLSVRDLC